jgi:hypothetical protein
MIRIQKLKRPNKRSGLKLMPRKLTIMRGIHVMNMNDFPVYVDKFTRKKKAIKR